jgi:hypothetical protein
MNKLLITLVLIIIGLFSANAQEDDIIVEDFEYSPEGWTIEDNSNSGASINNGAYNLINKLTNKPAGYYKEIKIDTDQDYTIEIKILQKAGQESSAFGLTWGRKSNDDYFSFKVKYDGFVKIDGKRAGKPFVILDWKKLKKKQIKRMGQSHILSVVKTDKGITYYLDDVKVHTGEKLIFMGNKLGIQLNHQMEVKVDFIRVIRKR